MATWQSVARTVSEKNPRLSGMDAAFCAYLIAAVFSLGATYLYLITQGWYLLKITGTRVSIGLSWSVFFLPGALLLPSVSVLFDRFRARNFVLGLELSKVLGFAVLAATLWIRPSAAAVYVFSAVLGVIYAPFFPSTYYFLKRFSDTRFGARGSSAFEFAIQAVVLISALAAGFIYTTHGFILLLSISSSASALAVLFLLLLPAETSRTKGQLGLRDKYRGLIFWRQFFSGKDEKERPPRIFALLHLVPQNLILAMTDFFGEHAKKRSLYESSSEEESSVSTFLSPPVRSIDVRPQDEGRESQNTILLPSFKNDG